MKGKKMFLFPEEARMIEGSKQYEEQFNRLISNKQIDKEGNVL